MPRSTSINPKSPSLYMRLLEILIVAAVYFTTAKIGQTLAIPPGNVTPVWIPSGIILAVVLIRGYYIWPGIFLGAFLGNVWAYIDPTSLSNILSCFFTGTANGIGDVLSAVGAAYLIKKPPVRKTPLAIVRISCGSLYSALWQDLRSVQFLA